MTGTIRRWDVLCNSRTVIGEWGWGCFLRALFTRCPTFLACCCTLVPAPEVAP